MLRFNKCFLIFCTVVLILLTQLLPYANSSTVPSASLNQSNPNTTPSLTSEQMPSNDTASMNNDIDLARRALIIYFNLLRTKQYGAAVVYHGSGYESLSNWNPDINPTDHISLLKNGCERNGLQCLKIKNVLSRQQISASEFKFIVQFEKPDWSTGNEKVFTQGPCCGAPDTGERNTDFEYVVKKVGGSFVVVTAPIYVP
jgi:hypothetical protein